MARSERPQGSTPGHRTVTAVVVHYRGTPYLQACLAACLQEAPIAEVIVVDNEGVGTSLRRTHADARIRVIQMSRNAGYGAAANVGLSEAPTDSVLVLNQDVVLSPGATDRLVEAGQAAGAWLIGPRLLDPRGMEEPLKTGFPAPLRWTPPGERGGGPWTHAPWISGAAMLFTPGHTGLRFDERLHMYAEDEELCWRVWRDGGRVAVAIDAEAVHESGSAARTRWTQGQITRRTVLNRARMVAWHAGWGALVPFGAAIISRRIRPRSPAQRHP